MDQEMNEWVKTFPGAITVVDANGIIIAMNDAAELGFKDDGGRDLIGKDVRACHPGLSRTKIEDLLKNRVENVYTIEKHGKKKLIYQVPWTRDGQYAGFVELSLVIPFDMPHFLRD